MSMGFVKLFGSIVNSSIWMESDQTRIVWITMLALADRDGVIDASIPGLARASGISLEDTKVALDKLLSPDEFSRTPDNEGRRIEAVEGGWRLLNYAKYRGKMSADEQREKARIRKRRQRERDQSVTRRDSHESHDIAEAEAEAEAEADTKTSTTKSSTDAEASDEGKAGNRFFKVSREEWGEYAKEIHLDDPGAPWDHYVSNGWKISGRAPMKDWKAALRNWKRNEGKFGRKPFKPESRESKEEVFIKPFLPES